MMSDRSSVYRHILSDCFFLFLISDKFPPFITESWILSNVASVTIDMTFKRKMGVCGICLVPACEYVGVQPLCVPIQGLEQDFRYSPLLSCLETGSLKELSVHCLGWAGKPPGSWRFIFLSSFCSQY